MCWLAVHDPRLAERAQWRSRPPQPVVGAGMSHVVLVLARWPRELRSCACWGEGSRTGQSASARLSWAATLPSFPGLRGGVAQSKEGVAVCVHCECRRILCHHPYYRLSARPQAAEAPSVPPCAVQNPPSPTVQQAPVYETYNTTRARAGESRRLRVLHHCPLSSGCH